MIPTHVGNEVARAERPTILWRAEAGDVLALLGMHRDFLAMRAWQETGSRARVDEDGFVRLSRVTRDGFSRLSRSYELLPMGGDAQRRHLAKERVGAHPSFPLLWEYQKEGAIFLAGRFRALLADEPGVGKTCTAITAADAVLGNCTGNGVLVVCPASAISVWRDEIARWARNGGDFRLHGSQERPCARWNVVSWDTLKQSGATWLRERRWEIVIGDEIHWARNPDNYRSRAARSLWSTHIWGLTGTPVVNSPVDVAGVLRAIRSPFAWHPKAATADDARQFARHLHEVVLRRTVDSLKDLPSLRRAIHALPITLATVPRDIAELTAHRVELSVRKAPLVAEHVLTLLDAGQAVVVFSCFLEPMRRIGEILGKALEKTPLVLDGSVPGKNRGEVVAAFQRGDVPVLLCQIVAGGEAVTLTRAAHVVFADLDYIPARHAQAEKRCHRAGQTRSVLCSYMVADDPVDQRLLELLGGKTRVMTLVHQAFLSEASDRAVRPSDLLDALRAG